MRATRTASGKWLTPAIFAAFLAILTFSVCFAGTYIYDDILILRIDKRFESITQIHRFWTESYHNGVDNLYRPLVSSSYAIEYWLHGDRPWIFHGVNVLLHALVSAMVAKLAQRLSGSRAAWIAGVLFAVHPIHVEPVANIVGRAELMCAAGCVGAMLYLLRNPFRTRDAIGVIACFVLALLSKEQGMLLPVLLGALWGCSRFVVLQSKASPICEAASGDVARLKSTFAILFIILGSYVVLRENVLGLKFWWDRIFLDWTINPLVREDADRVCMPLVLLGRYVSLLIAPYKLSPDYGATVIGWQVQWQQPWVYLGLAAMVVWIGMSWLAVQRRNGPMVFCLFALAVTYGIVGNIVSLIGVNFAERLMYLPSIFFLLIVAMLMEKPRAGTVLCSILAVLFVLRSVSYAARWNDALSFYTYSISQQPNAIRLRMLLVSEHLIRGDNAEKRGDLATAKDEFARAKHAVDQARQILPQYDELWVQSASVAIAQKDYDAADAFLDEAMQIASKDRRRSMMKASNWKSRVAELRAATRPASPED